MRGNETKTKRRTIEETAKLYQKWRAKKSSVKEIAKAMGLNSNYLYKILPRIAETLGIPYEELIFQQHHKVTESSVEGSSEISNELQNEEEVIEEAEETAESGVVDTIAETTEANETVEDASTTTEAQVTEAEEDKASPEEVAAPETEVSKEDVQEVITNAKLVEVLKNLSETRSLIEKLNIVQEVQK